MFEKASRSKFRFNTDRGLLSVEDLWDLPLTALDAIYKTMRSELRDQQQESLLEKDTDENETLSLKTEIIKHVVTVRLTERAALRDEADRHARKQRILEIIASKQDAELHDKSIDELAAMVESL